MSSRREAVDEVRHAAPVEHLLVLTLGRQSDPAHVRATPRKLAARGIELI